jgi:predicted MFS family arabinose efflux permease
MAKVFVPFAIAYLLSYLMRSVNAVLSDPLTQELTLSASELGLLSAAYFLTFAIMQIPLGALLDRRDPRTVEIALLVAAVIGCLVSAIAEGFLSLWIGRAMIGFGVSACLMAAYKAYRLCFAPERQSSLASLMLMVGSVGALLATVPVAFMLPIVGWRGIFFITAGCFGIAILALLWGLPNMPRPAQSQPGFWADTWQGAKTVFRHREIQRLIPFAIFMHGGFLAIQGLWLGPWFRIVDDQSITQTATSLLILGIVVIAAHLGMSALGTRFQRWGWSLDRVLGIGCLVMLAASTAAILDFWGHAVVGWSCVMVASSISGVSYAKASLTFPVQLAARASTAINFIVFVGAFGLQWGLGLLVDLFANAGFGPAASLRASFMVWLGTQAVAVVWFWAKGSGSRVPAEAQSPR